MNSLTIFRTYALKASRVALVASLILLMTCGLKAAYAQSDYGPSQTELAADRMAAEAAQAQADLDRQLADQARVEAEARWLASHDTPVQPQVQEPVSYSEPQPVAATGQHHEKQESSSGSGWLVWMLIIGGIWWGLAARKKG